MRLHTVTRKNSNKPLLSSPSLFLLAVLARLVPSCFVQNLKLTNGVFNIQRNQVLKPPKRKASCPPQLHNVLRHVKVCSMKHIGLEAFGCQLVTVLE